MILARRVINSPSGGDIPLFWKPLGHFLGFFPDAPFQHPEALGAQLALPRAGADPHAPWLISPWFPKPPEAEEQGPEKAVAGPLVLSDPGESAAAVEGLKATAQSHGGGRDSSLGSKQRWALSKAGAKTVSSAVLASTRIFPVCSVQWATK